MAAAGASDDDRSHVEALAVWCEQGSRQGTAALLDHLERVPDDALALLVVAPSIAFAGAGDALTDVWGYVERFAGVHGEAPWYLGLLAYGRTEQLRFFDAADLAEAALDADPTNGNGAHALAHVHYETDAHGTGLRWLTHWIGRAGRTQRYRPHFQWHAALHELAMGDAASAARRYNAHLAPPRSTGVRCLVDAGSASPGGPGSTPTGSPRPTRCRCWPRPASWPGPPAPRSSPSTPCSCTRPTRTSWRCAPAHRAGVSDVQEATLRDVGEGLAALIERSPVAALDHLLEALPGLPALGAAARSRRSSSRPRWPRCCGSALRARPPACCPVTAAVPPRGSSGAR